MFSIVNIHNASLMQSTPSLSQADNIIPASITTPCFDETMKLPPPPAEICKRRGITLAPIVTKCFDETSHGEYFTRIIPIHIPVAHDAGKDAFPLESETENLEISRWKATTEDSSSNYSELEIDSDFDYKESYEEKLERYQHLFDNRSLHRCLDDGEDELLADLLFNRLLREVQKPGLPFEESAGECRGEVQVRAFWLDVRKQLQVDDGFLEEDEWP